MKTKGLVFALMGTCFVHWLILAIHATLDVFGTMVDVIVSHNGQEEDPLELSHTP